MLVVDAQNAALTRAHERDLVVANITALVERARHDGTPVVWVQHSDDRLQTGSEPWRIVDELTPGDAESLIAKNYGDAFAHTNLYW